MTDPTLFDSDQAEDDHRRAEHHRELTFINAGASTTGHSYRDIDPAHHVRTTDPHTSRAAARKAIGNSALRQRIYDTFTYGGYTDDELAAMMIGTHPGSIAKRRHDLTRAGLLTDSGTTRPTRTGTQAIVWTLA